MGRQIQLGVFTLPRTPPCVVTQTKYTLRNQTAELLWRSAAIIPQVPTLFYAWISAPESTNRWLLVLCAHEWHVRAVKWSLSASQGKAVCVSVDHDAHLKLNKSMTIYFGSLDFGLWANENQKFSSEAEILVCKVPPNISGLTKGHFTSVYGNTQEWGNLCSWPLSRGI